jgi:L-alanine-DL-glutamate epimerase-like enolase superfamily enzyme
MPHRLIFLFFEYTDMTTLAGPLSLTFSTTSKLGAAQTELQACELHLAAKESELEVRRSAALREGLGARLKAMVDCGWAWGEVGREGLRTLELLGGENYSGNFCSSLP